MRSIRIKYFYLICVHFKRTHTHTNIHYVRLIVRDDDDDDDDDDNIHQSHYALVIFDVACCLLNGVHIIRVS